jgi:hypothetical protein
MLVDPWPFERNVLHHLHAHRRRRNPELFSSFPEIRRMLPKYRWCGSSILWLSSMGFSRGHRLYRCHRSVSSTAPTQALAKSVQMARRFSELAIRVLEEFSSQLPNWFLQLCALAFIRIGRSLLSWIVVLIMRSFSTTNFILDWKSLESVAKRTMSSWILSYSLLGSCIPRLISTSRTLDSQMVAYIYILITCANEYQPEESLTDTGQRSPVSMMMYRVRDAWL